MAAKAGKLCRVKVSGAPVAFTGEAVTTADDTVYQITDTSKRVWDRATTVTVYNDGVEVDAVADPYTINRLTGTITFESADNTRVITVDGDSLPLTVAAEAKEFDFTAAAALTEDTAFGDTEITRLPIEKDCSGSIGEWKSVDTQFIDAFDGEIPVVLEFSTDGGSTLLAKAWVLLSRFSTSGGAKTLVDETVAFDGSADVDGRSHVFL